MTYIHNGLISLFQISTFHQALSNCAGYIKRFFDKIQHKNIHYTTSVIHFLFVFVDSFRVVILFYAEHFFSLYNSHVLTDYFVTCFLWKTHHCHLQIKCIMPTINCNYKTNASLQARNFKCQSGNMYRWYNVGEQELNIYILISLQNYHFFTFHFHFTDIMALKKCSL